MVPKSGIKKSKFIIFRRYLGIVSVAHKLSGGKNSHCPLFVRYIGRECAYRILNLNENQARLVEALMALFLLINYCLYFTDSQLLISGNLTIDIISIQTFYSGC